MCIHTYTFYEALVCHFYFLSFSMWSKLDLFIKKRKKKEKNWRKKVLVCSRGKVCQKNKEWVTVIKSSSQFASFKSLKKYFLPYDDNCLNCCFMSSRIQTDLGLRWTSYVQCWWRGTNWKPNWWKWKRNWTRLSQSKSNRWSNPIVGLISGYLK